MKFNWEIFFTIILFLIIIGIFSFVLFYFRKEGSNNTPNVASISDLKSHLILPNSEEKINIKYFYAPILLYHHIANSKNPNSYYVSPEIFEKQMRWLKENGYHVISFDKLYEAITNKGTLPEKPVIISFDDSLLDQYKNAYPVLQKYNYSATFFVKLNNISNAALSWDKIKEMSDDGMIIGSHSVNHDNMTSMDEVTMNYELLQSKKEIEKHTGKQVKYFSYSGGAYSAETIAAVKKAGYLAAVCTKHKVYQEIINDNSIYTLPRIHIDNEMPTFIDWVQGKNLK